MGRSINLRPTPRDGTFYHRRSNRHYTISPSSIRRHQIDAKGDEINVVEKSIDMALGSGNSAVTFLHRTPQGRLLELPITWYRKAAGYEMSPGYDRTDHPDMRREVSDSCLFCHSAGPQPAPIDCHRCHGPTAAHLKSPKNGTVLNPAKLSAARQLEICLQCHLETSSRGIQEALRRPGRQTWSYRPGEPLTDYKVYFDRADSRETDRFEFNHAGYRLLASECFRKSKGTMTCTTCHDPHSGIVRRDACIQCHQQVHLQDAKIDRTACATCHMPRRIPADAIHTTVIDHKIVRQPSFRDPADEDHRPYEGRVVPYYGRSDALSLALANIRETSPESVALYKKRLAQAPKDVNVLTALGKALLRSNRPKDSVDPLKKAVRLDPMLTDARLHLGVAAALQGKYEDALSSLREATARDPDNALAWINLGITLEAVDDVSGAWDAYSEAIRLQPDSAEARRRRSMLGRRQ